MATQVKGWREVVRNLSSYEKRTVDRVVNAVQMTQAMVINDAKSIVPVRTANLQNSIGPGKIIIRNNSVEARVFALMEYASFVELGTSRQRAQPYLGPAILKNQGSFRQNMAKAMNP